MRRLKNSRRVKNTEGTLAMMTLLLLALGIAAFGAFAGYVAFCDRV